MLTLADYSPYYTPFAADSIGLLCPLDEPDDSPVAQFSAYPASFTIHLPSFTVYPAVQPSGNSRKYWILPPPAGL
jgi:hypothetical protein